MCWTFSIFIWCSCIQSVLMHTASWDLVTSPVVFGKPVELRCTVKLVGNASCCSGLTRIWSKGPTQILTNGFTSLPLKYNETIDAANKQFSLVINDLSKEDVDVVYTCAYGNKSPEKTLTQNDSFEYHPTEISCPVEIHNGELVGTLSVNMSAPYPAVFAQYGDSNFTLYLTTNITPVAGSTKFYTINSSIKRNATCNNDEKFTLSVLTGVTTTNICDNVTLCAVIHYGECWKYAGWYYWWSILGTILTITSLFIVVFSLRPNVQLQNETNCNVEFGTIVTWKCTVTSLFPGTTVCWVRHINPVYWNSDIDVKLVTGTIEKKSCITTIAVYDFKAKNRDHYTCIATNCVGKGYSSVIRLNVIKSLKELMAPRSDDSSGSPSERLEELDRLDEMTDQIFLTKKQKIRAIVSSLVVSAVVNALIVIPSGLNICSCIFGLELVAIELGVVTCYIPAAFVLYKMIADKHHLFILLVLLFVTTHLLILPYLLYKLYLWIQFKLNLCCKKTDKHLYYTDQMELENF